MKVADERVVRFERRLDPLGGLGGEARHDHDARGLLIAVMMCLACWLGLAFFLLG